MVCVLPPCRQREIETVKQLQEETAGQAEALGLELQKATKQLEDASKQVRDALVPSAQETNRYKRLRTMHRCPSERKSHVRNAVPHCKSGTSRGSKI